MSYPVVLNLSGRLVLVAGGGAVARRKVESLLEAGALVRLVSPDLIPELESLATRDGVEWRQKRFAPEDLAECHLAIAATDDNTVNQAVFKAAEEAGVFCNVVDQPALCSFTVPAVVRRGDLVIAVSTGGASPLLARRIKEDLANQFDEAWAEYLELLGRIRKAVMAKGGPSEMNRVTFQAVIEADLLTPLRQGDRAEVEKRLRTCCGLDLTEVERI